MKFTTVILNLLLMSATISVANADHHESMMTKTDIKVGAMVDVYYLRNLNDPSGGAALSNRNYDQKHNDFTMNLFELNLQGKHGDVGFYADLDFGDFAAQNSGDNISQNIGQAYLTYEKGGYTFSAGKMYTNVGFEVAKAQENWNYSRSFAFSIGGPFWHEGFSVTRSYDSGFGWGAYIYDNWDSRVESNNDEKTYSLQLNYTKDNFNFILNHITGHENTKIALDAEGESLESASKSVTEFNTTYKVNDSLTFAFNGVFGTDERAGSDNGEAVDTKWTAYVLYARYEMDKFSLTPRFETFTYENHALTADDSATAITEDTFTFTGITLTAGYALEAGSELRFEVRQDTTSEDFYVKDDELVDSQQTVSLSWMLTI